MMYIFCNTGLLIQHTSYAPFFYPCDDLVSLTISSAMVIVYVLFT